MSEYLLFRLALENALRSPAEPTAIRSLERTGDFFVNVSYPNFRGDDDPRFGDGSLSARREPSAVAPLGQRFSRTVFPLVFVRDPQNELPRRPGSNHSSRASYIFLATPISRKPPLLRHCPLPRRIRAWVGRCSAVRGQKMPRCSA